MPKALSKKARILILVLGVLFMATACPAPPTQAAADSWTFTVKVGYSPEMVAKYGGDVALQNLITNQLSTIASRFTGFKHPLQFIITRFYEYHSAYDEYNQPHPESDLHLIYSENVLVPGGWDGGNQIVVHSWHEIDDQMVWYGSAFAPHGTDGLTHEFGHFRGAVDTYALRVDGSENPIAPVGYGPESSYMDYPYDNNVWDSYSRCIIDKAGSLGNVGSIVASNLPSTYRVQVNTSTGAALSGASVKLYRVPWYLHTVSTTADVTGTTSSAGVFQLSSNPFRPFETTEPWDVVAGNFLVEARKGSQVSYSWLPIDKAGLSGCIDTQSPFVVTVTLG